MSAHKNVTMVKPYIAFALKEVKKRHWPFGGKMAHAFCIEAGVGEKTLHNWDYYANPSFEVYLRVMDALGFELKIVRKTSQEQST